MGYAVGGMPVGKPCVLIARAPRVMTIGDRRALPASRKHSDASTCVVEKIFQAVNGLIRDFGELYNCLSYNKYG